MKKKLLVMLIIAMMVFMAACTAKQAPPAEEPADDSAEEEAEEAAGEESSEEAEAPQEGGAELQIGQVITAAHGNKCFTQATAVVQGDVVVAAFIDEYQFAAADQVMGVPNSDATEGFAAGYAEGQVLLSKRMEADYYSANMAEKAGSTVPINENFDAIQDFAAGKTIAELADFKGKEDAVDAVSEATLVDTGNYLAAIAEAATVAQGTEAVSFAGDVSALKLHVEVGAAHGDKCFSTAAALTDGTTIVLSWLDEFQFAPADQVMGVPNSDATDGFAAGYAEGQVLLSKRMEADYYSELMASHAGSTVRIDENYNAIQAAVNGLSIDDAKALAGQGEAAIDAVSGATLADTAGYVSLIVDAATNAK